MPPSSGIFREARFSLIGSAALAAPLSDETKVSLPKKRFLLVGFFQILQKEFCPVEIFNIDMITVGKLFP